MTTRLKSSPPGPVTWTLQRDDDGHRTYKVKLIVLSDDRRDGPYTVLLTPGLPAPGDWWVVGNDEDLWATCLPTCSLTPMVEKEPNFQWLCEFTFSTKPPPHNAQRCNDTPVGDPLLEPMKISGGSSKYTEEKAYDRFGTPILNSAFEQFKGPQVEFDASRSSVKVEMNVPGLDLNFIDRYLDTLNDDWLWGYPPRCVKFSKRDWDRKFYGSCEVYYTLTLEFDIFIRPDGASGFDRELLDQGTKALHGENRNGTWVITNFPDGTVPNFLDPMHFVQFKDKNGDNKSCILDGFGVPVHGPQPFTLGQTPRTYYLCILEDASLRINDPTFWVTLGGPPSQQVTAWEAREYELGDLVSFIPTEEGGGDEEIFVWTERERSTEDQVPGRDPGWLAVVFNNHGRYDPNVPATYQPGDFVTIGGPLGTGTGPGTMPGKILVEYYPSSNLLELGIPAVLT